MKSFWIVLGSILSTVINGDTRTDFLSSSSSSKQRRRAQALTASPTANATSSKPTVIPSSKPSSVPTSVPSTTPTSIPSLIPTASPTFVPTAVPTTAPTSLPTAVPTTAPTAAPTSLPTAVSTTAPTAGPVIVNVSITESPVIIYGITEKPVIVNASMVTESPVIDMLSVLESDKPTGYPTNILTTENVTLIPVSNANMTNIDDGRDGNILVIFLTMLFAIIALCIGYRAISKPKNSLQETSVIVELASQVEPHMMPQVIRSEYGGWQGTYTDEQMSNVDVESHVESLRQFSIDDNNNPPPEVFMDVSNTPGSNYSDTANDLRMIEHADSTDEALMRAYEDAMNVDIEPEDPSVMALLKGDSPGSMTGMGSSPIMPNDSSNNRSVARISPGQQIDLPDLPPVT